MLSNLKNSFKVIILTLFITGFLYPLFIMSLSHVFFNKKSRGSLIYNENKEVIGSELIGQNFTDPAYFFPRPSSAGKGYDGMQSGGSNLAITSKKFLTNIQQRIIKIKSFNEAAPIPIDLVTSSASGLDPHISSEAAYWQAPRIAIQRNISLKRIIAIIDKHIIDPDLFILGDRRLNVLYLNLALNQFFGPPEKKR